MSKRIEFIPQLDSLRTLAALMVILHHYLPSFQICETFEFGKYGVEIFFTISGFLITTILLKQKDLEYKTFKKIKNFIIKRALRLFPVYYLILIVFTVLSLAGLYVWDKGNGAFYYTYTANILFFFDGMKGGQLNHVWTLSVEEQFYLVWPFLIFSLDLKKIHWLIVGLIIFSLVFKSLELPRGRMLTISHFDTLGLGALLAWHMHIGPKEWLRTFTRKIPMFPLAVVLVLVFQVQQVLLGNPVVEAVLLDALSIVLIAGCILGYQGLFGKFMDLRIMTYLGKISYGLYIFHKPISYFLHLIPQQLGYTLNKYAGITLAMGLTVLVAHFSYILIEKRFIRLKDKFDL